jgi:DNA polymerase
MTRIEPAELGELARQARAYLEALRDSGIDELPAGRRAKSSTAHALAGERAPRAGSAGVGGSAAGAAPAVVTSPAAALAHAAAARTNDAREPRAMVSSEERRRRLALIAEEVAGCTRCELHKTRTKTAFARGNPDAELVFIGEGPGTQEDRQGEPFVGPAGQLLDKMIAAMGYHRDDVYVMNIVKCRASEPNDPKKDRKPAAEEMAACRPFLERQLDLVLGKVIVALGATAVQGLTGANAGITGMRGTWRLFQGRIPLMPTFHPAYLLRSPEKKREVWDDLKQVMQRLGKEPQART